MSVLSLSKGRYRASAGDCQNPQPSGPAHPRPAALPGASDSIYSKRLKSPNRLPTQADGAARSEFERAPRRRTNRAPPTAAPPKPAEATPGFSSSRKGIDNSQARRYCWGQKKGGLNFLYISSASAGPAGVGFASTARPPVRLRTSAVPPHTAALGRALEAIAHRRRGPAEMRLQRRAGRGRRRQPAGA